MGVVTARLVFLAFVGLTGTIIYNALYLQEVNPTASGGVRKLKAVPELAQPQVEVEVAKIPPVSTDLPPLEVGDGTPKLLVKAVQRELASRGYDVGPDDGTLSSKTRRAISDYEDSHDLPVTGLATDALLRHILLGDSVKPAGTTGSVAASGAAGSEKGDLTIKAVQQVLADLGYDPGPVDGAMGASTMRAISAFQRDRKIDQTGKITPALIGELKRVTGRDPSKTAATR